jgi:hypothetical protein
VGCLAGALEIDIATLTSTCGINVEKDIGVQIDEELSFEQHISTKVRVANAIMGQIRRSFTFLDQDTFKKYTWRKTKVQGVYI